MTDPRSIEDRFEIERRLFEYAYTYDSGDADGWANLFTEDGVWEAVSVADPATATVVLRGREELSAFVRNGPASRPGVRVLHHQSAVVFDELDTAGARTRSTVIVTLQRPDVHEPQLLRHGVYLDRWVKTPGGWRIAHRRFESYQNQSREGGPAS